MGRGVHRAMPNRSNDIARLNAKAATRPAAAHSAEREPVPAVESLLEEGHIKLSSGISDLLGTCARRRAAGVKTASCQSEAARSRPR